MTKSKSVSIIQHIILLFGVLIIFVPMFFVIINAFKSNLEIADQWFALPKGFYLDNFKTIFEKKDIFISLRNSFIIAGSFLVISILIIPLAAYGVTRPLNENKFFKFLYFFMLFGLFVPFQAKMIPLVIITSKLKMMNVAGIIVVYLASATCEGIFLCGGYLQSIPKDLEESAYIDGSSYIRTYISIIFPLMKPIIATVCIQNILWIWNDFQLPLLMLNKSNRFWTLVLYVYNFKTAYQTNHGAIFASFIVSMLPIMVFYFMMQKQIVGGITSGAVKG